MQITGNILQYKKNTVYLQPKLLVGGVANTQV